jgi:hypothetical protein
MLPTKSKTWTTNYQIVKLIAEGRLFKKETLMRYVSADQIYVAKVYRVAAINPEFLKQFYKITQHS